MSFLLVPNKLFSSLSASDKHAVGHISSRKPVVPCGRIEVSSLHCGCSKPGLNPGQDSILLSGSGNMTLLFATSSYSWILCLKLFGVMCCCKTGANVSGPPPSRGQKAPLGESTKLSLAYVIQDAAHWGNPQSCLLHM